MTRAAVATVRPMLTIPQVMERLSLCYDSVWQLIQKGELPAAKFGQWRIDPDDLEAFIETRKQNALARLRTDDAPSAPVLDADLLLPRVDNPFERAN